MKEEVNGLSDYENKVLTMLTLEILNGKRKHEIILLHLLLNQEEVEYDEYIDHLKKSNCPVDDATISSVTNVLDLSFFTQSYKTKYGEVPVILLDKDNRFRFNDSTYESLHQNKYFKDLVHDVVQCAMEKNKLYRLDQPLTLYEKYTRKDACRLLNWKNDESSTIFGYKTKHQTCPIFVTYHKKDEVESSVNYGDEFLSPDVLKWYTRSNRTLESQEVRQIIDAKENHIDVHIFVKKDDDEGTDFYYLGQATPDKNTVEQDKMEDGKPVVHMNMVMEHGVDSKLYGYIKSGLNE